jgi:hypothetical protein
MACRLCRAAVLSLVYGLVVGLLLGGLIAEVAL